MTAADGRKTVTAKLREFTADSLLEPLAEAAIYQRFSIRQKCWVEADPPLQLVRMVLTRNQRWAFPHVSGIITMPTLRCDGSLLAAPGYDQRSELFMPAYGCRQFPNVRPAAAEEALAIVKELFSGSSSTKHSLFSRDLGIVDRSAAGSLRRRSISWQPTRRNCKSCARRHRHGCEWPLLPSHRSRGGKEEFEKRSGDI